MAVRSKAGSRTKQTGGRARARRPEAGDPAGASFVGAQSEDPHPSSGAAENAQRSSRKEPEPDEASGLAAQASLFIRQAASVLEREVAAGIIATRSLENRFVDVAKVRGSSPNEVMQRFRRDAHEVIDIVMDLLAVGVQSVEGVAQRAIRITQSARSAGQQQGAGANVPTISPEQAAQPGSVVVAEMALENSGDEMRELAGFQASDLIAASGERIEAQQISFDPEPVAIAPHGKARLRIAIAVPLGAQPGVCSGLMMARQMDQVRALIAIEVAGPAA
jgi:hypothetical protein